jgi:hypothetical protein
VRCGKHAPDDAEDLRHWELLAWDTDDIICPRCRVDGWKIPTSAGIGGRFSRIPR